MHSLQHEIMPGLLQTSVMQLQHKVPVTSIKEAFGIINPDAQHL